MKRIAVPLLALLVACGGSNEAPAPVPSIPLPSGSALKPFVYGTALQHHGHSKVLAHVGVEPSGNPFNAILVDDTNRPFNPMVKAGAIVTTAMIETDSTMLAALSR